MSIALRNPGEYRGEIFDYALIDKKGQDGQFAGLSLAIKIRASEVWMVPDGGGEATWLDCSAWDAHGEDYIVLISKAGKVNENRIGQLLKHAGWDGDFQTIADHSWVPTPVRFTVKQDSYNNQIQYKIDWINAFDSVPGGGGGGGNVDADRARALNSQFGPAVRAIASNVRPKPAPSTAKPAAPAVRQPRQPRQNYIPQAQESLSSVKDDDGIPF